jgi:phosphoribosyl 1,2-cyclic phosphodiesterase
MRVTFWGTRGSIAAPGPETARYGGNTACVEVRADRHILILDAGTGIRPLGLALAREFSGRPLTVHLFITHTHWDHIQGFPFFVPVFARDTTIRVYGAPGQGRSLEKVLRGQMESDYFPVGLGDLAATIDVQEFRGTDIEIGDVTVAATYLNHPGMNLAYRVSHAGRRLVYATDHEPYAQTLDRLAGRGDEGRVFGERLDAGVVAFAHEADLLIADAQYTDEEYTRRIGWGHSPLSATVALATAARVKALALYHHDPLHADDVVAEMERLACAMIAAGGAAIRCFAAADGLSLTLD